MRREQETKQYFSIRKFKAYGTQSAAIGVMAIALMGFGKHVSADQVSTNDNTPTTSEIVTPLNTTDNGEISTDITASPSEASSEMTTTNINNGEQDLSNTIETDTISNSTNTTTPSNTAKPVVKATMQAVTPKAVLPTNPAVTIDYTRIDAGKQSNDFTEYVAKPVTINANIKIGGTATVINNSYLTFTFNGISYPRISAINNQNPRSLGNGVYRLDLGNLISGTTISIPITFNEGGNGTIENGSKFTILTQLFDGLNVLQNEAQHEIVQKALTDLPTVSTDLIKNDAGVVNGAQVVGFIDDATGQKYGRSTRNYEITPDAAFIEKLKTFFGITDANILNTNNIFTYGGLADGYSARISIPADQIGQWKLTNVTPMSGLPTDGSHFNSDGYIDLPIDGYYLSRLFSGNQNKFSSFALIYAGDSDVVPDSIFKVSLYKNGELVTSVPETSYSHANIWVHQPIPIVKDIAITTNIYFDGNSGYSPLSSFADGEGVSLANDVRDTKLHTVTKITNTTNYPNEIAVPVSKIGAEVAKQIDGDNYFTNSTVKITSENNSNINWINSGKLYYLDGAGNRIDLGTYAEYVSKNYPIISNATYIGLDMDNFIPFYDTVFFNIDQSRDANYVFKSSDDITGYKNTDKYTTVRDNNAYKYTADVTYQPDSSSPNSKNAVYKSNLAGLIDEYYSFRSMVDNTPTGAVVGQSGSIMLKNILDTLKTYGNPIVDSSAYIFIAVPANLTIKPTTNDPLNPYKFSDKLTLDNVIYNKDGKGLDYYIYKLADNKIINDIENSIDYTVNQEIFLNNPNTSVLNSKVATGIVFKNSERYIGNEVDPLDVDGDGKTSATGTDRGDIFVVSAYQDFSAVTPKALFIFDKTSGSSGQADFNKQDVIAGDVVTIYPQIANTTDAPYTNMTVVTALPRTGDLVYAGNKARGSQISPVLVGPATPLTGWVATYSTTNQIPGTAVSDLIDWKDESQISDWTTVTAIKWVSDPGVQLQKGESVNFSYQLKTPADAKMGESFTTTSAISINGSSQFLEGYRSVTAIKVYPMTVTGRVFVDKDANGSYENTDGGQSGLTIYLVDANGNQVNNRDGQPISVTTNSDGSYSISVPYPDTNYNVKVVSEIPNATYAPGNSDISSPLNLNETNNSAVRDFILVEKQLAHFIFIDKTDGNKELQRDNVSGQTGDAIGYDAQTQLDGYLAKGYVVESRPASYDPNQVYTSDAGDNEEFVYVLVHGTQDVSETDTVTRVINYIYNDGITENRPTLKDTVNQVADFNRTGVKDLVTGHISYNAWTSTNNNFSNEVTPLVQGFLADKGQVNEIVVNAGDSDIEELVTYKQLGSYVPNLPQLPETPYPNDSNDPTIPGIPGVIPYVPGYTPEGPDGKPLVPVDPSDPSKGYLPPSIPNDPTIDTPITYVPIKTPSVSIPVNPTKSKVHNDGNPTNNNVNKELPHTGEEKNPVDVLGMLAILAALGVTTQYGRKKVD